jgi:hypothetical protein
MNSWAEWALSFLVPRGSRRSDVLELTEARDDDPARYRLFFMLLRAIRDGDNQIRFEQRPHSVRVFYASSQRESEDCPLNPELGRRFITAAKTFPRKSTPLDAECRTRRVPVLVGGHPVDLDFEWLPGVHGEGVTIRITDRSTRNTDAGAVKAHDAEDFASVIMEDGGEEESQQQPQQQQQQQQQTPGESWLWYLECMGGRIESAEFRQEWEEWARKAEAPSRSPDTSDREKAF